MIGSTTKIFYPEFITQEKEITLDSSKIASADVTGLTYPAIWISKTLAYELGWFEDDTDKSDPQFAVKLGPNLCIKLNR